MLPECAAPCLINESISDWELLRKEPQSEVRRTSGAFPLAYSKTNKTGASWGMEMADYSRYDDIA